MFLRPETGALRRSAGLRPGSLLPRPATSSCRAGGRRSSGRGAGGVEECARLGRRSIRTPADAHSCGFRRKNVSAPGDGRTPPERRPPARLALAPASDQFVPGRRPALQWWRRGRSGGVRPARAQKHPDASGRTFVRIPAEECFCARGRAQKHPDASGRTFVRLPAEECFCARDGRTPMVARRLTALGRSADFQSAVAPDCIRQTAPVSEMAGMGGPACRLQTGATADYKSALRGGRSGSGGAGGAEECARLGRRSIRTPAGGHACGFRRNGVSVPGTGALRWLRVARRYTSTVAKLQNGVARAVRRVPVTN